MTVKELINKLKEMPEDAEVEMEILIANSGFVSMETGWIDEVFESSENTVVLQSIY